MAEQAIAHFQNDIGADVIEVGVRQLMCCGASAPFDHPHVFLDMGSDGEIICGYCSTVYRYNPVLAAGETKPEGCQFLETERPVRTDVPA